jgi:hypothetical protein
MEVTDDTEVTEVKEDSEECGDLARLISHRCP